MFDDDFFEKLPSDPSQAAFMIISAFYVFNDEYPQMNQKIHVYETYLDFFAIIQSMLDILDVQYEMPTLSASKNDNINIIIGFTNKAMKEISERKVGSSASNYKQRIITKFKEYHLYNFTDGDLTKIQTLLNEMREIVVSSNLFVDDHKARILNKLEGLQKELHKKMPSLDKLWGLIGDMRVALGKFGEDAKPFVDRISEILQIVWRTQAKAEELPSASPFPLLTHEHADEE
jgi:hypothetical protein